MNFFESYNVFFSESFLKDNWASIRQKHPEKSEVYYEDYDFQSSGQQKSISVPLNQEAA